MMFRGALRRAIWAGVTATLLLSAPAWSAPSSFGKADAAWHQGDLEKARELYEAALKEGGLEPSEVLLAYSRIGTVRAAMRDKQAALSAFRVAAAIDPKFELPADSGPAAQKLYARARREAEQQGGERLSLQLKLPETVAQEQAFSVETSIPAGYAVLVQEVVVRVEDPVTGKSWLRNKPAEPSLSFEFPHRAATPGARLSVKASAVDSQRNAWAVAESKLRVEGTRPSAAVAAARPTPAPSATEDKQDDAFLNLDGPLPWIIGGAVIVGGILVYAATRPSDEVAVGAPSWR